MYLTKELEHALQISAVTSLSSSERISAAEVTSDSYKIRFPRDFRGITRVNLTLAAVWEWSAHLGDALCAKRHQILRDFSFVRVN